MSGYSKACCTLPPAQAEDYTPKGDYQNIDGLKTYVTGNTSASKAIFWIYDVFGYTPPTIQGADIIASAGYLVMIPDLLNSRFAQGQWYNDPSEESVKAKNEFMNYIRDWPQRMETLHTALAGLKAQFKSVQKWGSIGFCWGGKVVAITSGPDSPWSVGVQSSPGMVDAKDAEKISTPHMMLASKDESVDEVKAFGEALKGPKVIETFSDQMHGWMGARGELKTASIKAEYERGYRLAVGFFQEHL